MKKPKYTKDWGVYQKEEKKKKVSKPFIWTLIISAVMIFSTIGFIYVGNEQQGTSFTYKDKYEIFRENNAFVYNEGGNRFIFKFFPSELENLVNGTDMSGIKKQVLSITFNPNSELVSYMDLLRLEFSEYSPKLGITILYGVTENNSKYNFTMVDCEDATPNMPVIKFAKSNETAIMKEGDCYIFNAKNEYDIVKLRDILLYSLLGIL